jgi:hypothetical protein
MPRKLELDALVPGTPEEVAERVKNLTRWSLQPYRGGPITFGAKPLKGTVSDGSVNVGLNRRDWFSMLQPTAKAALEPTSTGTRIRGSVGMPDWLVWLLRAVILGGLPAAFGLAAYQLLGAGQPLILAAFLLFGIVVSVLGTGAHVAHANEQVDALKAEVLEAAGASIAPVSASSEELEEAMREAEGSATRQMEAER